MIRRFDPIDILFIVLISCYLITFFIIVLFFVRKYLQERKRKNKPFEELKLPSQDEIKKTKTSKRVASKGKTNKRNAVAKSGSKKAKKSNSSKKASTSKKKGPNNSKKSTYSRTKNTKKKKTARTKNKAKTSKKKLKK